MGDSKNAVAKSDAAPRRQQRGVLTRQQLLRSARKVFARDGFEHARVEDIAADAGRTRGAFYANFKDKEDVFYGMFEDTIDRGFVAVEALLNSLSSTEERIAALAKYLSSLSKDRERMLLSLEFKMYAIRHPQQRKRLTETHSLMRLRCCIPGVDQLLPKFKQSAKKQLTASFALGGVVEGLVLNHFFDPKVLNAKELERYLKLSLRQIFLAQ